MSEVQKILEDFGLHLCSQDDAEQALYDLLMEKTEEFYYYSDDSDTREVTRVVRVSTINGLFGRTE